MQTPATTKIATAREAPLQHFPLRTAVGAFILVFGAFLFAGQLTGLMGSAFAQRIWHVIDPVQHNVPTSRPAPSEPIAQQLRA